jgi:spindle assembly abnormal protein 6
LKQSFPSLPQTDLRVAKEKAKRKQAILVRQEEELGAREAAAASAARDAAAAAAAADALKSEVR